jgi:hypothetical protein
MSKGSTALVKSGALYRLWLAAPGRAHSGTGIFRHCWAIATQNRASSNIFA